MKQGIRLGEQGKFTRSPHCVLINDRLWKIKWMKRGQDRARLRPRRDRKLRRKSFARASFTALRCQSGALLMTYTTDCTQNGCGDGSVSREPSGYTSFLVLLTYFIAISFHRKRSGIGRGSADGKRRDERLNNAEICRFFAVSFPIFYRIFFSINWVPHKWNRSILYN